MFSGRKWKKKGLASRLPYFLSNPQKWPASSLKLPRPHPARWGCLHMTQASLIPGGKELGKSWQVLKASHSSRKQRPVMEL